MSDSYETAYKAAATYAWEVQTDILAALQEAVDAKEVTDTEELSDRLRESIDSDAAVIYTGRATCYVFGSRNDGAAEDHMGENTPISIEQRAYYAIETDVMNRPEWEELVNQLENAGGDV